MSRAMWQLKALASSKREILSPDWSCSTVTLRARPSTLCSHCSDKEVPSLSVAQRPCPSQGFVGNRVSTCLGDQETDHQSSFTLCQMVQTNQRARLKRFRKDKGLEWHCLRESHRLFPDKEEEKLTVRPMLPKVIPIPIAGPSMIPLLLLSCRPVTML